MLLGCRSPSKGEAALSSLLQQNLPGTIELLPLDVTSDTSIASAAAHVSSKYGRLDALVNNAGITPRDDDGPMTPARLSASLTAAFRTNATGPAILVETFAPLLAKSITTPRIVNVTSGAGSIGMRADESNSHQEMKLVAYRASKAALNMLTACQAREYGGRGWKVFCFCPGFTVSNLGPFNKAELGAKPNE